MSDHPCNKKCCIKCTNRAVKECQGANGAKGVTGATGATGATGPTGPAGSGVDVAALYAEIRDAIVSLIIYTHEGEPENCSGSIISPNGLILTCAHCVIDDSDPKNPKPEQAFFALITSVNGTSQNLVYRCKLIGYDGAGDSAVLLADPEDPYNSQNPPITNQKFLEFGDSRSKRPGDPCFVLGDPLGEDIQSISEGIIRDPVYFQTNLDAQFVVEGMNITAATYQGNSGSPIVDENGLIIGILALGPRIDGSPAEAFSWGATQFILEPVVEALTTQPNPHVDSNFNPPRYLKGFLGFVGLPVSIDPLVRFTEITEVTGFFATRVDENGPAGKAQPIPIEDLDILLSFDGIILGILPGMVPPTSITWTKLPGEQVVVRFLDASNGYTEATTIITLGEFPIELDLPNRAVMSKNDGIKKRKACCLQKNIGLIQNKNKTAITTKPIHPKPVKKVIVVKKKPALKKPQPKKKK